MRVKLSLLASASIGLCAAMPAAAQSTAASDTNSQQSASTDAAATQTADTSKDQTANTNNDIVVTASYGQSLQKAMIKKRNAPVVIEALSISDLNQLPDVSVADALSRLPGLAADRDSNNGAKSEISLRGMGAALTLGTLNGRDQATTTPDRNVRYDQFPSELIGGATVYKSPMASLIEGGVSGSIDLQTVHPLDYRTHRITLNVQGAYNPYGDQYAADKKFGYRDSISYIDQFFGNTLGVAVGFANRKEPYNELRTQYASLDPGGYADLSTPPDGFVDNASYGLYQTLRTGEDKRNALVGVIEWKPSSRLHLTIDSMWSKVKLDGTINGLTVANLNQEWANSYTNTQVIGGSATKHGALAAGTVTGIPGLAGYETDFEPYAGISRRDDNFWSLGGNLVWNATDQLELASDLAYSHVKYRADYWELRSQPLQNVGGVLSPMDGQSTTFDALGKVPTFTSNVDLTDPSIVRPYSLTMPFLENGRDSSFNWKEDLTYHIDGGVLSAIRVGFRMTDRTKSNDTGSGGSTLAINDRPILGSQYLEPYALGSYSGLQANAAPKFIAYDFYKVANDFFGGLSVYQTDVDKTESWRVNEKTYAGYGQIDFGGEGPLSGNAGVRVIATRDTSSSFSLEDPGTGVNVVTPFTVKNNYTDVLPSLNLTYKVGSDVQLRLGLAKTIARPAVDDLNAGFQTYAYAPNFTAYGGNPKLEPYRAKQVDLGVEYYFGKNSFAAVTGFYKSLGTYITTSTQTINIDGQDYLAYRPVNAKGGHIKGFEATFQMAFDKLPAPFDGLGFYANYARVDSDVKVSRNYSDITLGLIGLSKNTGTATLWYAKSGFEGRLSYNYRGSYPFVVDGGAFETVDAAGYLDAQVSYDIRKGVQLYVQASNLTNTAYSTHIENSQIRGRYAQYGRIFYVGARFTF